MKCIAMSLIVLLASISLLAQINLAPITENDREENPYRIAPNNDVVPNPEPEHINDGLIRGRESFFYIDFEDYPVGEAPGDPWIYGPGVDTATISEPAYSGQNALGIVSDYSYSNTNLSYPISITSEDGNVEIRVKIRPPHYVPSTYGNGYVTLASHMIHFDQGTYNPGVIFETQKPYGSSVQPSHYTIRTKGGWGSSIGTFLPGEYHDVITTFDWEAETAYTVISRPDGISYTETWEIEGSELQEISFSGGANNLPESTRFAMFDDIEVTGPAELISPEVSISVSADTVFLNWQEVPEANSYFIYASDNPTAADWGEYIAQVEVLEFSEAVQENKIFYKVVASTEPIRNSNKINNVNN